MIKLSDRLQAVANLCPKGTNVADIGTDHGYLPIYLVEAGIANKAFALDLREGPLQGATANIKHAGLSDKITTRLSNGLDKLERDEANVITICGMGGRLITEILSNGMDKITKETTLILSPQSEVREFRQFLIDNNISIEQENIVFDDGKFYFIIVCKLAKNGLLKNYSEVELRYGRILLSSKNSVLKDYLLKEKASSESILNNLKTKNNSALSSRINELLADIEIINQGLHYYE